MNYLSIASRFLPYLVIIFGYFYYEREIKILKKFADHDQDRIHSIEKDRDWNMEVMKDKAKVLSDKVNDLEQKLMRKSIAAVMPSSMSRDEWLRSFTQSPEPEVGTQVKDGVNTKTYRGNGIWSTTLLGHTYVPANRDANHEAEVLVVKGVMFEKGDVVDTEETPSDIL